MESPDHGGSSQGGRGTEHRAARCCARCVCWGEVPVGSAPAAVIRANSERLSSKRFHKLIVMTPARYFPPPRYRRLRAMPAAIAGAIVTIWYAPAREPLRWSPRRMSNSPLCRIPSDYARLRILVRTSSPSPHTALVLLALPSYRPPPPLVPILTSGNLLFRIHSYSIITAEKARGTA